MKKINKLSCLLLLSSFVLIGCGPVGGTQIAYVDVAKVMRDSKVGKDINRQINAYKDKIDKRMRPEGERLQREYARIAQQRSTLSASAFANKQQAFQEKYILFNQKVKEEGEKLTSGAQEQLEEIKSVLNEIYEELLDKHTLDMLLESEMVLDSNVNTNLTDEVIAMLDDRLTSVKLTVPKE